MRFVQLPGSAPPAAPPRDAVFLTASLCLSPTPAGTLAVHAPSGGWAYLDAAELALIGEITDRGARRAAELAAALATDTGRTERLLTGLWGRGLVAADGVWAIDAGEQERAATAAASEVFSLAMVLSTGCNLACGYCYFEHQDPRAWRKMSKAEALAAVAMVLERHAGPAVVDLGEVAAAGALWREIVAALPELPQARDRAVRVLIQTNGTTLDDDDLAFAAEHDVSVGVSLDGPAQMHDRARVFRGGGGTHRKVTQTLERLADRGLPHWIVTTVGRHNVDAPARVIEHLAGFPAAPFALKPILPAGEANRSWATLGIRAEEYAGFLRGAVRHGLRLAPARLDLTSRQFLARLLGRRDGWAKGCTSRICGCGETRLVFEAGGRWTPCPRFGEYASAAGAPLPDGVAGPRLGLPPWSRGLPGACEPCPWHAACGGGCALSGPDDPHCTAYRGHFEAIFADVIPAILDDPRLGEAVFGAIEAISVPP